MFHVSGYVHSYRVLIYIHISALHVACIMFDHCLYKTKLRLRSYGMTSGQDIAFFHNLYTPFQFKIFNYNSFLSLLFCYFFLQMFPLSATTQRVPAVLCREFLWSALFYSCTHQIPKESNVINRSFLFFYSGESLIFCVVEEYTAQRLISYVVGSRVDVKQTILIDLVQAFGNVTFKS